MNKILGSFLSVLNGLAWESPRLFFKYLAYLFLLSVGITTNLNKNSLIKRSLSEKITSFYESSFKAFLEILTTFTNILWNSNHRF